MECPVCGYLMDAFDIECPRCKRLGEKAPTGSNKVKTQVQQSHSPDIHQPEEAHFCTNCGMRLSGAGDTCPRCTAATTSAVPSLDSEEGGADEQPLSAISPSSPQSDVSPTYHQNGTVQPSEAQRQQSGNYQLALLSFVSSLVGVCTCGLSALGALPLGLIALSRMKQCGQRNGKWMALTGVILSSLIIILTLWGVMLFRDPYSGTWVDEKNPNIQFVIQKTRNGYELNNDNSGQGLPLRQDDGKLYIGILGTIEVGIPGKTLKVKSMGKTDIYRRK